VLGVATAGPGRQSPPLGPLAAVLADALDQNLAIGVRAAVADHLGRAPTRAELTAARRAAHSLAALGRARVLHVPAEVDADTGDRNSLVLAKPNVIMNDIRLRGLAVAESDAAGRKSPHNHARSQDGSTASPTHSVASRDQLRDSLAQLLMRSAVATLCGGLPHGAMLLRARWSHATIAHRSDHNRSRSSGKNAMSVKSA
jgi:hypothetical protein